MGSEEKWYTVAGVLIVLAVLVAANRGCAMREEARVKCLDKGHSVAECNQFIN